MALLVWSSSFDTGIAAVDRQHHVLVDMINEVAPVLSSNESVSDEQSRYLLDQMSAYAVTHFKTEESLMKHHGVDARHVALHTSEHAHFIEQIVLFREELNQDINSTMGPKLLAYLMHWLSFHILDEDQQMARQIASIRQGQPPALAYEISFLSPKDDVSREPLVAALSDIYALTNVRRRSMEEVRSLGGIDQMTGLTNRPHFVKLLNRAVADAEDSNSMLGLLLVDVDDFATIDEKAGYGLADLVVTTLAERLHRNTRRLDLCARTDNDKFAIALIGGDDVVAMTEVTNRLFSDLMAPVLYEDQLIGFSLSGGVAFFPQDATDANHLLAAAELTQVTVHKEGGGKCKRFDPQMGFPGHVRSTAVLSLREAIFNNQLVLHYQPQVSLHSGEVIGLEALVRWQHPEKGIIPPGQFIPLAEETGLIIPLGDWVLREALGQIQSWRELDFPDVRVAVNLSARHFLVPGLAESIEKLLNDYRVPPHLFELELTESVIMHDPALAIRVVNQLKELGVKLSLDDFGTGYSSLAYLSRFAFDTLKIDQSFVRDITTNPVNASIAVATIAMAHKLGKSVIAEGVETEGQMLYLRRHDCDEMQGYFFSRPQPSDVVAEMLRKGAAQHFGPTLLKDLPCLLLVDDEIVILNSLKRLLRREGYRVLTADSGPKALELLASNAIQVILSDQRMPNMAGSEFLARVKDMYPNTVRMVLSGHSELSAVTEMVNRGAIYKFLSKPWKDDELKQEVRLAFRYHRETFGSQSPLAIR